MGKCRKPRERRKLSKSLKRKAKNRKENREAKNKRRIDENAKVKKGSKEVLRPSKPALLKLLLHYS
jgi:hypothetical protein